MSELNGFCCMWENIHLCQHDPQSLFIFGTRSQFRFQFELLCTSINFTYSISGLLMCGLTKCWNASLGSVLSANTWHHILVPESVLRTGNRRWRMDGKWLSHVISYFLFESRHQKSCLSLSGKMVLVKSITREHCWSLTVAFVNVLNAPMCTTCDNSWP